MIVSYIIFLTALGIFRRLLIECEDLAFAEKPNYERYIHEMTESAGT